MTVVVRPAARGDIEAVLALWGAGRTAHAITPDTPEALERLLATDPWGLLVAEEEGEVRGALIAAWDGWRGNLYRLAVDPAHRRRGIARRLVRAGEERLRERGAPRITALVAFEDDDARAFWAAAGYEADADIGRMVRSLL
jgi:ribosomal protein S18 acetylase RimI-like enzyme